MSFWAQMGTTPGDTNRIKAYLRTTAAPKITGGRGDI